MPVFPQYENATLVQFANYVKTALTGSAGASIAANSGDVQIVEVNVANVSGVALITLPPVALGGPVVVKYSSNNHEADFGSAAVVTVVPQVIDTVAGTLINGYGSITLTNIGDEVVLASDGVQWWTISKAHNTHDTY